MLGGGLASGASLPHPTCVTFIRSLLAHSSPRTPGHSESVSLASGVPGGASYWDCSDQQGGHGPAREQPGSQRGRAN